MRSFNSMTLDEKAELLWSTGKFLESIYYYGNTVSLYAIDNKFIEVYYDQDSNHIGQIIQVDEQGLKKYLSRIKFST